MADTTSIYGWPYQEAADPPDGAQLGQDLAEAIEATVDGLDDRLDTAEARVTALRAGVFAHMNNSGVQSLANGTARIQAEFNTAVLDVPGAQCNLASDRLDIVQDGVYIVIAQATFALNVTGQRYVSIYRNASASNLAISTVQAAPTFPTRVQVVTPPTRLFAADDIRVGVCQNSGGALNTDNTQGGVFAGLYRIAD